MAPKTLTSGQTRYLDRNAILEQAPAEVHGRREQMLNELKLQESLVGLALWYCAI